MQAYSDPKRESDPHLPDVEVFYRDGSEIFKCERYGHCSQCGKQANADGYGSDDRLCYDCAIEMYPKGYYWWSCFPGCLPDSDPVGPFATREDALQDAQSGCEWDDDDNNCLDCGHAIDGEPCHIDGGIYCRECSEARREW